MNFGNESVDGRGRTGANGIGRRVGTIDQWLAALTFLSAMGSGLIAGVFYAFSTFVMKALARIPAAEGMTAMQSINVVVLNPLFLGAFLGTAAAGATAIVAALLRWREAGSLGMLLGGLLYVVGTFGVTAAFNVPLNESLARVSRGDADLEPRWADYVRRWTAWNHVRTAAALAAAAAFALAFRRIGVGQ